MMLRLLILFVFVTKFDAIEVALLASSGCYSHDVMMEEVGREFDGHNVSWLQARVFQFNVNPVKVPKNWNKVIVDGVEEDGIKVQRDGGKLIWQMNLPMDHTRPWDLKGSLLFFNILKYHYRGCAKFVKSNQFQDYLRHRKADLIIIDHFLQEFFIGTSSLLNGTSVMFSNWPIADGYITSINIPGNPSVVPKTGTMFSSSKSMKFFERIHNTIFHSLIVIARQIHAFCVNNLFVEWGYKNVDLDQIQAKHLLYAGRSEFLAEAIRPISNRLKHFGCARCRNKSNYYIQRPSTLILKSTSKSHNSSSTEKSISPQGLSIVIQNRNIPTLEPKNETSSHHCSTEILTKMNNSKIEDIDILRDSFSRGCNSKLEPIKDAKLGIQSIGLEKMLMGNLTEMEERYVKTQLEFKDLDLQFLYEGPFVLISFGSVAQTELMPKELLDEFLNTLNALAPLRFIFQTNSDPKELIGDREIPSNLILLQWAPIKVLLAHQNLQYAILHGGVNTINELLFFGVPLFGVPLQGDQQSNVQRLVELGMAEISIINELYKPGNFLLKLQQFHSKLPQLRKRARKVSKMIENYRELNGNSQNFWLNWAQRSGPKIQSLDSKGNRRRYFKDEPQNSIDYFAIKELSVWMGLVGFLLLLFSY